MASNYSTFVVAFRSHVDLELEDQVPDDVEQTELERRTRFLVSELNSQADALSEEVERELGRMLPPGISARVQLSFSTGSLVVGGLLTLFAWAMPIIATKALETVTDRALGLGLDRVLRGWEPRTSGGLAPRGPLSVQTQFSALPSLHESTSPEPTPPAASLRPVFGGAGATVLLLVDTVLLIALVLIEALRIAHIP